MVNWYCRYYNYQETGFYYLQTRYYDPAICRFINADTFATTDIEGLLSTNMFSYCENNPVMGVDPNGEFLDTVFDVVSLGMSIADVVKHPSDPWAWAGLVGDAVDLIPCITGVGETVRSISTTRRVVSKVDTIRDGSKVGENILDFSKAKPVHGNSKKSAKIQHGYEIYVKDSGDVVKTGISGVPLNKNGTSPRANSQVNAWNKSAGADIYAARVVKTNIPGRQAALDWEIANTQRLWDAGNSLSRHLRPNPIGR